MVCLSRTNTKKQNTLGAILSVFSLILTVITIVIGLIIYNRPLVSFSEEMMFHEDNVTYFNMEFDKSYKVEIQYKEYTLELEDKVTELRGILDNNFGYGSYKIKLNNIYELNVNILR